MTTALFLAALLPVIPQPTEWKPTTGHCELKSATVAELRINDAKLGTEGYRIQIEPGRVRVLANDRQGFLWARQTLAQLTAAGDTAECGEILDVPKYRVRGFVMDVGRMYHSMEFLRDLARTMAYYKFNTLHIHLNDNEIIKPPQFPTTDWSKVPAAFRLEATTYPELTAQDGAYTKREFREFMLYCRNLGITVVPEFDMPAHALAFTRVKPEFASKLYGEDHFDLEKRDEILAWLKPLLAEYMTGEEPTFIGPYMHVGTDEYNPAAAEQFRDFSDKLFKLVRSMNYRVCAWGALTHAKGTTPVLADRDITMDIWYNPFYQPAEALEAGYTLVSVPDGYVYIVPFAGYYYDYLNCKFLYNNWEPRQIGKFVVPEDKLDQLAGGKFALWNDLLGKKKDGTPYTESDNWDRLHPALQTLGQKFWSGKRDDQEWLQFSKLANGLKEPEGVKFRHTFKLKP